MHDDQTTAPSRIPFKGGAEHDALSRRAKRFHHWAPGERKAIKRGYWHRVRRIVRDILNGATADE